MIEVEIKARVFTEDFSEIIHFLTASGFSKEETVRQEDDYYNHPSRDFNDTDEALRIRRIVFEDGTDETVLTYKGRNLAGTGQSREELECSISDAEMIRTILERLGFRTDISVYKTRQVYTRNDFTACLDTVDGLGNYFELEIIGPEDQREENLDRLKALLKEIEFASPEFENRTYRELMISKMING